MLRGRDEGTFVVRNSTSTEGDYALSVVIGKKPRHYRILHRTDRHSDDQVFILLLPDRRSYYDSLDELIRACKEGEVLSVKDDGKIMMVKLMEPLKREEKDVHTRTI